MSRFSKFMSVIALVGLMAGSTGCKVKKETASPEDYWPLILIALDGGKTAAMIGRNEFIEKKNFGGCVATEVLISAFGSAQDVLSGKMQDKVILPALELDLEECLKIKGDTPQGHEDLVPLIEGVSDIALMTGEFYAKKLKRHDCKKGTAALGAIAYIRGLIKPITDTVAKPGSMISIPAVEITFDDCK